MNNRQKLFFQIASKSDAMILHSLDSDRVLSGTDLSALIERAASYLMGQAVTSQSRLIVNLPNGLELALLYLAALRVGLIVIPVAPDTPKNDLDYMIQLAKPDFSIGTGLGPARNIAWTLELLEQQTVRNLEPIPTNFDDIFSITFTSGSTGRPKAVVHRAETLLGNAVAFNRAVAYGPEQRHFHVMPMFYMAGILNSLICPLIAGAFVLLGASFSPRSALTFWRQLIDHQITSFWLSPTMAQMAMKLDRTNDSITYMRDSFHFAFCGTAPLPPALYRQFAERYGRPLLQSYGLSELLLIAVDHPGKEQAGSVGFVLPELNLNFADDGELTVDTPYCQWGYLDPDTGALPSAHEGSFATGDLAELGADRRLTITGRKKDLIIVGGVNVSPVAIENLVAQHRGVGDVAVLAEPDELLGEMPLVAITLVEGFSLETVRSELESAFEAGLSKSAKPKRILSVDQMPKGPTGKIQKPTLKAQLQARGLLS